MEPDSKTEHFSDALWADFVRNVGDAASHHAIEQHLAAGCPGCQAVANRFRAVVQMALNERMLLLPEELVQRAKEIAVAPMSSGWIENLTAVVAQLIQSSPLDWQPAGVRSLGEVPTMAGDRMLFRAAEYGVYLKVEPLPGGEAAEIIGEIVNEREQNESLEGIPVQMVARGQTLSETATNRFGEFLIEYPVRKNVTLRFALKHKGQRLDLPLESGLDHQTSGEQK